MKLLTMTGLILIFMIEPVLACDISPPFLEAHENNVFYSKILFYFSLAIFISIVTLYFLRKRNGLWIVITAVISILLTSLFGLIALILIGMCLDIVYNIVRFEFIILLSLFFFQLFSWISQRKYI